MTEKHIINFINNEFKDYKIKIFVEEKKIRYYNSNNDWLGTLFLKTNEFDSSYWFYNNLIEHFKNIDEMKEFIKPVLEKIIGRSLNRVI